MTDLLTGLVDLMLLGVSVAALVWLGVDPAWAAVCSGFVIFVSGLEV